MNDSIRGSRSRSVDLSTIRAAIARIVFPVPFNRGDVIAYTSGERTEVVDRIRCLRFDTKRRVTHSHLSLTFFLILFSFRLSHVNRSVFRLCFLSIQKKLLLCVFFSLPLFQVAYANPLFDPLCISREH